jgi:hypothetical protein
MDLDRRLLRRLGVAAPASAASFPSITEVRMSQDADPVQSAKRQRALEARVVEHVAGLFDDRRFVIPTAFGPRPLASMQRQVSRWDRATQIKRRMVELDRPDFELQDAMPTGLGLDVTLARQVLLAFSQPMAHLRFASLPPVDTLIRGEAGEPLSASAVREAVQALPASRKPVGGPMTLILFAGSGFTVDARQVARTFVDGPPTILIEPDAAGGFRLSGPPGSEFLIELLDPEQWPERRQRVVQALEERDVDLLTGGVSLEAVAQATKLPEHVVEVAAREWAQARQRSGGDPLRVKRVDGSLMLYADSSLAAGSGVDTAASAATMGVMDRLRRLFGADVSPQRKIAELAERRAALSRQRDRAYDEMGKLEQREDQLRQAFQNDESTSARRRITSQLLQLQKDLERRRQTVSILNQQINVVGTHLHNLEIARTGTGQLPKSEEIAADAAKAEEVLADLQASNELADELAGTVEASGLSKEEQTLYDELLADTDDSPPLTNTPAFEREIPALPERPSQGEAQEPPRSEPAEPANPAADQPEAGRIDDPRRAEAEAS